MEIAEQVYRELRAFGVSPQEVRTVLPDSLKTEIVITANLREWRHIFLMRTSSKAHPQMREIMVPLLLKFQKMVSVIFDDFEVDASNKCANKIENYYKKE